MKHYNPSITQWQQRILQGKGEYPLSEVEDTPILVVPISPVANIVRRASATNATSATIYTTPADKDFYLTSAQLATIKDVTSTSTDETISAIIGGTSTILLNIPSITLTVQTGATSIIFNPPVLIDRNTAITVTNGTNVATIKSTGCITGYTVETITQNVS